MNIIEIAQEYYTIRPKGHGVYDIHMPSGELDSIVLWEETNSYFRYSTRKGGGPREFLQYVVGLSLEEISEKLGEEREVNPLLKVLNHKKNLRNDTGLAIQELVGEEGYNNYIKSRNISRETSDKFHLEVSGKDVIIPLDDIRGRRIGSLIRYNNPAHKGDRYRTFMAGTYEKPFCWPMNNIRNLQSDSIIILVEGAWSAMRLDQVIKPLFPRIVPLATLGTNLTEELRDYIYDFPIVAILDKDEGGNKVAETLLSWQKKRIKVESYEPKFPDDTAAYVDDLSDEGLVELFEFIRGRSRILK